MSKWLLKASAGFVVLLAASVVGADLETRPLRSSRSVMKPRVVHVETIEGRLHILGEALPVGAGLEVALGGERLRVLASSRSHVVAELPPTPPERLNELVVERGVRRVVLRGRVLEWGLRWPAPQAPLPVELVPALRIELVPMDEAS